MNDTSLEQWKQTRSLGKQRFIWLNGLLLWSVLTGAILYVLLMEMQFLSTLNCLLLTGIGVLGVVLVGYWYGNRIWKQNENLYQRLVYTENESNKINTTVKISTVVDEANGTSKISQPKFHENRVRMENRSLNEYIREYERETAAQLYRNISRHR